MVKTSLDPLNVRKNPNIPDSEERTDELIAEFTRKLEYIGESYQLFKTADQHLNSFNESLARLKRGVKRKKPVKKRVRRIHRELEYLITKEAFNILGLSDPYDLKDLTQEAIEIAAKKVAQTTKPKHKRPADYNLRHHVLGLMALITELSGKRVTANRYRNSLYDPHLSEGISQIIKQVFSRVDPDVTQTQLANIVRDARKKFAGKSMHFMNFFPLYGSSFDMETNSLNAGPGYEVKEFGLISPIYCP